MKVLTRTSALIFLSYLYINFGITTSNEIEMLENVKGSLKENFHSSPIAVIVNCSRRMSSTSVIILTEITINFLTIFVEMHRLNCTIFAPMRNLLLDWSERKVSKIIIIESESNENVEQRLIEQMNFLISSTVTSVRPKCLIFLINEEVHTMFLKFFNHCWLHKFLYVTIIQITKQNENNHMLSTAMHKKISTTIHQYNPFDDLYKSAEFTQNTSLFDDKLQQLHGISLYVGFLEEFPDVMTNLNYKGKSAFNALYGVHVAITKILAEFLNFTVTATVLFENKSNLARFNISQYSTPEAFKNELVDFSVNFRIIVGETSIENRSYELNCFSHQTYYQMIVKQFSENKIDISKSFIVFTLATVVFVTVVIVFTHLLRSTLDVWSVLNILRILFSMSITKIPDTLSARLFFLFLSYSTLIFSIQVLDLLLSSYFVKQNYANLNTVQDLLDSNIIPSFTTTAKTFLSSSYVKNLRDLGNMSKKMPQHENYLDCMQELIDDRYNVSGCQVDNQLGKIMATIYSKRSNGWILHLVEEPLLTGYYAMPLSKISPYGDRFNQVVRRLCDSGLIQIFRERVIRKYVSEGYTFLNYEFLSSSSMTEDYTELSLTMLNTLFFIGCLAAFFCFIGEVCYHRLQDKFSNLIYYLLKHLHSQTAM